jgi:hypothetical protein
MVRKMNLLEATMRSERMNLAQERMTVNHSRNLAETPTNSQDTLMMKVSGGTYTLGVMSSAEAMWTVAT